MSWGLGVLQSGLQICISYGQVKANEIAKATLYGKSTLSYLLIFVLRCFQLCAFF